MVKTHEKSRLYATVGTRAVGNIGDVIVQIEATGVKNGDGFIYLVETVKKEEYDRTTAESRAERAEQKAKEYRDALLETSDNLNAEKAAAEELLAQETDRRKQAEAKLRETEYEYIKIRAALKECRRIFGELPEEIEKLIEEGEKIK